jgi:superfamily II DNA or RNA helicase
MALRDYQQRAVNGIEEAWNTNQSTMVVMPTGSGKTVLFAEIIKRRYPLRTLVIAHREELILQAMDKIERFAEVDCDIEMGNRHCAENLFHSSPVVIATVQTLTSGRIKPRMSKFNPMDFSTIVIDEFHHATASSYRKVLEYFKTNPAIKVLGVTATPDRSDSMALGQVCESVAFEYGIVDAINDGWLVPIHQQMVTIGGLDFSSIRTTAGDLNGADLARVMEMEKNLHGMCSSTLSIIGDRQAIVFATSVRHAEMACSIFNRHKAGIADWVCGKTDKEDRRKVMDSVVRGDTQILCNVGVATEGFDAPKVEVIVMARPTKSRSLYSQMAGRATRPLAGVVDNFPNAEARKYAISQSAKPNALLIDFCGNSGKHKLITGGDILGGKYSDEVIDLSHKIIERGSGRGSMDIAMALDQANNELIATKKREQERIRLADEAKKARVVAKATFSSRTVNPFDQYDLHDSIGGRSKFKREYDTSGMGLSEKQQAIIKSSGINPSDISAGDGKKLVKATMDRWKSGLCTEKQSKLLSRYGYDGDKTTAKDAKMLIDAIAKNGWKKPEAKKLRIEL